MLFRSGPRRGRRRRWGRSPRPRRKGGRGRQGRGQRRATATTATSRTMLPEQRKREPASNAGPVWRAPAGARMNTTQRALRLARALGAAGARNAIVGEAWSSPFLSIPGERKRERKQLGGEKKRMKCDGGRAQAFTFRFSSSSGIGSTAQRLSSRVFSADRTSRARFRSLLAPFPPCLSKPRCDEPPAAAARLLSCCSRRHSRPSQSSLGLGRRSRAAPFWSFKVSMSTERRMYPIEWRRLKMEGRARLSWTRRRIVPGVSAEP